MAKSVEKRAAVNGTWARRCDKALFVLGKTNVNMGDPMAQLLSNPDVLQVDAPEQRKYLPQKVQKALEYAYRRFNDSFDWILKCDDDTYVIMENLKLLLSKFNPNDPGYVGYRMKPRIPRGYMSGGAGYLISKAGLRAIFKNRNQTTCTKAKGDEDVVIGQCLQESGVPILDSWDEQGKETFNAEPLRSYLYPPYPKWLEHYGWRKPIFGPGCCSQHAITFHHVEPSDMLVYEHLLYKTAIAGR